MCEVLVNGVDRVLVGVEPTFLVDVGNLVLVPGLEPVIIVTIFRLFVFFFLSRVRIVIFRLFITIMR